VAVTPVIVVRVLFAPTVVASVWAATLSDVVNMKKQTSYLTLSAITSALITAVMLASYFPFLTYAVPAVAGVFVIIPLVESGKGYALATYIVSAALVILFAEPEAKLMYVCFFGFYPIVKAVFERLKSRVLEYLLKFITFNGAVTLVYLVFTKLFMIEVEGLGDFGKYSVLILYVMGNFAFVLYDICLNRLCTFYMLRLHEKVKKILRF
jgi:hypothetical protein